MYGPGLDEAELIEGLWHVGGRCETDLFSEEVTEAIELEGMGFPLDRWIQSEFRKRRLCPHCSAYLAKATHELSGNMPDEVGLCELWLCPRCGFWQWHALQDHGDIWSGVAASITRAFDSKIPPECAGELAQYLIRDPDRWHDLHPTLLEKLVADIFRANYADADVIHVGGPGDLGVDVIFVESADREWLIQVKRRRKGTSEGFETLQKLLGTLLLKGGRYGIIATTADHFTHAVHKQIGRAADVGVPIDLVDKGKLIRMIDPLMPENPWRRQFTKLFPISRLTPTQQANVESALVESLPPPRQLRLF
ncbi:restriction endonuclease [Ensifer sp. R-19]|uniref:restriction endonuclease n=1 Tax=Ensifer sp. R-19 TaxID=3404055 RepID=UPI003CE6A73D